MAPGEGRGEWRAVEGHWTVLWAVSCGLEHNGLGGTYKQAQAGTNGTKTVPLRTTVICLGGVLGPSLSGRELRSSAQFRKVSCALALSQTLFSVPLVNHCPYQCKHQHLRQQRHASSSGQVCNVARPITRLSFSHFRFLLLRHVAKFGTNEAASSYDVFPSAPFRYDSFLGQGTSRQAGKHASKQRTHTWMDQ